MIFKKNDSKIFIKILFNILLQIINNLTLKSY
jgi:hypothetical protein